MSEKRISVLDMRPGELEALVSSLGQPAFRARQVREWVFQHYVLDFADMTNLPRGLREQLTSRAYVLPVEIAAEQFSGDGMTSKFLLRLRDGQTIESVLLRQPCGQGEERRSVCLSSQVGCPVGCAFCATGRSGFSRHLSAGEIIGQVLLFAARLADEGQPRPITSVVFMGQGEPLLNIAQTKRAVEILNSPSGLDLGARHITISTAGVVPGILDMARWPWQVGLAVSLHAPNDALRNELVPLNRRYPMSQLLAACRTYGEASGRRVTFEYTLIDGVNDAASQARELAARLRGQLGHVNLIPLNATLGASYRPSPRRRVLAFQAELQSLGVPCTVRVERGGDIDAACGQLRRRTMQRASDGREPIARLNS